MLQGKVALVTGAARGIGRGIALRFAREGAAVGVLDLAASGCEAVTAEILTLGGRAVALAADAGNAQEVREAVAKLTVAAGPPTVLVHNAAVMPEGTIDRTTEADWDRVYAVNVKGAFLTCRESIPLMRKAGGGSIILLASITGVIGVPGLAAYASTKGALISLARAMAIDHAREGIRANAVSPGTVDSPMLHDFVARQADPELTRRAFDEIQPRGKIGTIDEVANVVTFLASDLAGFVNGANIIVDGGMSIQGRQPRL